MLADCRKHVALPEEMRRLERGKRLVDELRISLKRGEREHGFQIHDAADRLDEACARFSDVEFFQQPFFRLCRDAGREFKPDETALGFLAQRDLDFGHQVGDGLFVDGKIHVAGDAEHGALLDFRAGKEQIEVVLNEFFRGDADQAVCRTFDLDESWNHRGNFKDCEFFRLFL